MIEYNEQEALRYMGAEVHDKTSRQLCQEVYSVLAKEIQPKNLIERMSCSVEPDGVKIGKVKFCSKNLAAHLAGCKELLLFAATLGVKADIAIKKLTLESLAKGNAAQAVAAALIEEYCNDTLKNYGTAPLQQLARFSPGYGDWALNEQEKFFSLMQCQKIGLTLTSSDMMAPVKSVTAVVGLKEQADKDKINRCSVCGLDSCQFRKE